MRDLLAEWTTSMRRDDFDAAWAASDAVLRSRDPAAQDDPRLPYHERWVWDGRPFQDRHVLVRCYHGLGDTLQFARYLPALRARAASVTVEAQAELVPLLRGADRVIPFVPDAPAPPSECDIEVMELAHALRLRPEAAPPPYVRAGLAPRPDVSGRGVIGLCWQAGGWDPDRSIPADLIAPLTARRCVALQPRPTELRVLNPEGCPGDIAETAALIAGLDLVVTVDTMVAHLAGALGRPAWVLLKHGADWRWGAGERSVWYPSIRLYRQPAPGEWGPVVERVLADLRATPCVDADAKPVG